MRKDMVREQEKRQRGAHRAKAEQNIDHPRGEEHGKDLEKAVSSEKAELKKKAKAKEELKRM